MKCLEFAFSQLDNVNGHNLILAIGNTGCGKSTMLNSLIHGSHVLKEVEHTDEASNSTLPNGKLKKRKVIDIQNDLKNNDEYFFFGIGHSNSKSETFLPAIHCEEKKDVSWIDIAGLNDTSGDLTHFINSFVTKEIFQRAKNVKFLLPITPQQIEEQRGKAIRQQIQVVQNLCQGNLDNLIKCMLPVLTKVKVTDTEFDLVTMQWNMAE